MDAHSFDAITRRASLLTLGAAGLAALGLTGAADARKRNGNGNGNRKNGNNGKNGKNGKNRKQDKGKINARCKKQVGECEAFLAPQCEVENCDEIIACCSFLGKCNADGFFTCLFEQQPSEL